MPRYIVTVPIDVTLELTASDPAGAREVAWSCLAVTLGRPTPNIYQMAVDLPAGEVMVTPRHDEREVAPFYLIETHGPCDMMVCCHCLPVGLTPDHVALQPLTTGEDYRCDVYDHDEGADNAVLSRLDKAGAAEA